MKEYCANCPIPDIMSRISISRNLAQTANANIVASESPNQAEPFQIEAKMNVGNLRNAMNDLDCFVRSGKKCQSCTF